MTTDELVGMLDLKSKVRLLTAELLAIVPAGATRVGVLGIGDWKLRAGTWSLVSSRM